MSSSIKVTVGDYGNQTVAVVGGDTITAQPGQDGYIQGFVIRGGDGYSGGGDYGTAVIGTLQTFYNAFALLRHYANFSK